MALDFIAWSAVALLRTELAHGFLHAPEPDALEQPGWYTDPLWGKAQRYWDAADWTERVRTSGGQEAISRLRPPDPQPSRPAQAGPVGPTVTQVLAEWDPGSPAADLARWREGITRAAAPGREPGRDEGISGTDVRRADPLPAGYRYLRRIA